MTFQIGVTIAVLVLAMAMFIWNKIPAAAVAVAVPLILHLFGVIDAATVFSGFVNNNVILFVAMFIVGGALFETGMAHKIAGLVTRFAKNERQMMVAVMIVSGIMSAFLSNTGTAAVLMPIVIGISAKSGFNRAKLLMPLVFGATIGAMVTLLGSPGNLTASATLEEATGVGFNFFTLTAVGLPMLILGALFLYFIGYKMIPSRECPEAVDVKEESFKDVPAWKQWGSLVVLLIVVFAMIFEKKIGVKMHIVASLGAALLLFLGILNDRKAFGYISWNTIFLVAGMLPMATALNNTGAGEMIAKAVVGLLGTNASPVLITAVLWLLTCFLTQFMSNSATVVMMCPLGIQIAKELGANPTAVVIAILAGGSLAFCTPIAQPQNTMIYGPGGYRFSDYLRAGWAISILCFVICVVILPIAYPFF